MFYGPLDVNTKTAIQSFLGEMFKRTRMIILCDIDIQISITFDVHFLRYLWTFMSI